jgi:hypothetical protein
LVDFRASAGFFLCAEREKIKRSAVLGCSAAAGCRGTEPCGAAQRCDRRRSCDQGRQGGDGLRTILSLPRPCPDPVKRLGRQGSLGPCGPQLVRTVCRSPAIMSRVPCCKVVPRHFAAALLHPCAAPRRSISRHLAGSSAGAPRWHPCAAPPCSAGTQLSGAAPRHGTAAPPCGAAPRCDRRRSHDQGKLRVGMLLRTIFRALAPGLARARWAGLGPDRVPAPSSRSPGLGA